MAFPEFWISTQILSHESLHCGSAKCLPIFQIPTKFGILISKGVINLARNKYCEVVDANPHVSSPGREQSQQLQEEGKDESSRGVSFSVVSRRLAPGVWSWRQTAICRQLNLSVFVYTTASFQQQSCTTLKAPFAFDCAAQISNFPSQ